MKTRDKITYWLDIAEYDIKTAQSLHRSGRYLYAVFTCQQTIEKILKALHLSEYAKEAPYSHNLVYLQSLLSLDLHEDYVKLLAELTAYYIEGRYPSYKTKLSTMISKEKSADVLRRTKRLFKWLRLKIE
jgi:HEPN domain-containing protein